MVQSPTAAELDWVYTPAEAEANFHQQQSGQTMVALLKRNSLHKTRCDSKSQINFMIYFNALGN